MVHGFTESSLKVQGVSLEDDERLTAGSGQVSLEIALPYISSLEHFNL